jgi:antitoxin (DNA-binding transcriptional repressor) of toxin-antitoxin stability system
MRYSGEMKSASVEQLTQQWPVIQKWVAAGEEVQVTEQDQVVAMVVPAKRVGTPDFLARAKAVWGDAPAGPALSAIVSEARGGGA